MPALCLSLLIALLSNAFALGQRQPDEHNLRTWSQMSSKERFYALTYNPPSYQKYILSLLTDEANRVAAELRLPEGLPITETNLVDLYVTPPLLARGLRALGNISTKNYSYYVSVGYRFSSLVKQGLQSDYLSWQMAYKWPISQLDTNAAYQLATQFLAAVQIDVGRLNRDCALQIEALMPHGKKGRSFVPLYWVYWVPKSFQGEGSIASVELFLPKRLLLQMHISRAEYILRKPLVVTNIDLDFPNAKGIK